MQGLPGWQHHRGTRGRAEPPASHLLPGATTATTTLREPPATAANLPGAGWAPYRAGSPGDACRYLGRAAAGSRGGRGAAAGPRRPGGSGGGRGAGGEAVSSVSLGLDLHIGRKVTADGEEGGKDQHGDYRGIFSQPIAATAPVMTPSQHKVTTLPQERRGISPGGCGGVPGLPAGCVPPRSFFPLNPFTLQPFFPALLSLCREGSPEPPHLPLGTVDMGTTGSPQATRGGWGAPR